MAADPVTTLLEDPRFKGQPITRAVTPAEYDAIRHAWLTHVSAEERLFVPYTEAVWQAQMAAMLSVLSDDCLMSLVPTGEKWQGKAAADAFYRAFIPSFDGMQWVPQSLVFGPQGVLDVVNMTGTLLHPFASLANVGETVHQQWVIYFPWLPDEGKLGGEIIHSIRPLTAIEQAAMLAPT